MLYNVAMELTVGATVGKLVVGVRVVMADGSKITPGASILRNLLRIVDWLPFFYLVGAIAIWAGPRRQRIGDRAAKTAVIAAGSNAPGTEHLGGAEPQMSSAPTAPSAPQVGQGSEPGATAPPPMPPPPPPMPPAGG